MPKSIEKTWAIIGGVAGLVAILALVVTVAQLGQSKLASDNQDSAQSTQIAIISEQLDVQRQMATLQASSAGAGPTSTHIAEQIQVLESTAVALTTKEASIVNRVYPYSVKLVVDAKKEWLNSEILINKGDTISITSVSGKWRTASTYSWSNGFDCSSNLCVDCLSTKAPEASLIFKVGNGTMLCAGKSPFKSSNPGILYLSFNDISGSFYDNEGQITIQITITRD